MTEHVRIENVNPDEILDKLTYWSYAHNRRISPEITPEQWATVWPGAPALEAKFQEEENARRIARNARQTEELRAGEDNESTVYLDGDDDGSGLAPHQR